MRLFSLWTKMTRMLCLLGLIDWLAWSFIALFFEFLDGFYDLRTSRSVSVHSLIHALFQVSDLLLRLARLSVLASSLLQFRSNEWKSLVFSLISSVPFLFSSIDYIVWFVDRSIYVFGLLDTGKKLLLVSFIMLWIWSMLVCSELWKFSLKCFMWKIHFAFYEKKNIILVYLSENIALVASWRS